MNKRVLINMLNKYINLFLDGSLTLDECIKVFDKRQFLPLDDNVVLYEEVNLLCKIYENVPYYEIEEFILNFSQTLDNISADNKKMLRILKILIAYLSGITNNLSERVKTVVDAHIYAMLKEYSLYKSLNLEKTKKLLTVNTINPVNLFSLDVAENGLYKQDSLFGNDEENLRDEISKSNYNRTINIERTVCNIICKNFSEDEFKSFFDIIMSIIKETNNYKLEDLYKTRYDEILKRCSKKWSNQSSEELLLSFLNKDINHKKMIK